MFNWFNTYHFEDGFILWFLLIVPILITHHFLSKKSKNSSLKSASLKLFNGIESNYGKWINHSKLILKMLGITFLIIASARPQES